MNVLSNELLENFINEFQDKETRHIYLEDFQNSYIATQIKVLREQRGWTQAELAEKAGMKQERISVLEDVNYSSWTLSALRRLARAFDLRIKLAFEDFDSFLKEFTTFNRKELERKPFKDSYIFSGKWKKEPISRADVYFSSVGIENVIVEVKNTPQHLRLAASTSESELSPQPTFQYQQGDIHLVKRSLQINDSSDKSSKTRNEVVNFPKRMRKSSLRG